MSHIRKKKAYKLQLALAERLKQFMDEVDLSAAALADLLGRDRETIGKWLDGHEQAVPDWVDLIIMRKYAGEQRRPYDFYSFADQPTESVFHITVDDRPGIILDLAALVYEFHGSVRRIDASATGGEGDILLHVEHPHSQEALEQAIRSTRGVREVRQGTSG